MYTSCVSISKMYFYLTVHKDFTTKRKQKAEGVDAKASWNKSKYIIIVILSLFEYFYTCFSSFASLLSILSTTV